MKWLIILKNRICTWTQTRNDNDGYLLIIKIGQLLVKKESTLYK